MAMVSTREFLPYVLPNAPQVMALSAEFALRLAAIEYCERTRCWRHLVEQDFLTGANGPAIVCPDYAAIHDIERATWDYERRLTPITWSDLPPAWATDPEAVPESITQSGPDTVTLYPFQPGHLSLSLYLKPRPERDFARTGLPMDDYFNQLPDLLLTQHAEAIGWGALARLLVIPERPYTDPNRAAYFQAQFNDRCDKNFDKNKMGQQRAPRRTRYHDY